LCFKIVNPAVFLSCTSGWREPVCPWNIAVQIPYVWPSQDTYVCW